MEAEKDKMETETSKEETVTNTIITVNVKTPKEKKAIKIEENASIKNFKAKIGFPVHCMPYTLETKKDKNVRGMFDSFAKKSKNPHSIV